jgi:hypothetical protein
MLKIAMLIAISERAGFFLTEDIMQRALNIVNSANTTSAGVIERVSTWGRGEHQSYIYDLIRKAGIISKSDLGKRCFRRMSESDMKDATQMLELSGMITIELVEERRAGKIRSITYYRLSSVKTEDRR